MHKLHHYHIYDVINTSLPWAGRVWRGRVISTCPFVRLSLCSAVPLISLTLMTSLAPRPRGGGCGGVGEASRLADSIVEVESIIPYYSPFLAFDLTHTGHTLGTYRTYTQDTHWKHTGHTQHTHWAQTGYTLDHELL